MQPDLISNLTKNDTVLNETEIGLVEEIREWEAEIAKRADIRYGEQENLQRGQGHVTMPGYVLILTTIVGSVLFLLIFIQRLLSWFMAMYRDYKEPESTS